MLIKILKLHQNVKTPLQADPGSSGFDIFSRECSILLPKERRTFQTGFKLEIPEGWEAQIRSRSGLSSRHGIIVLNSPGTIDSSFRGEIGVILYNSGSLPYGIREHDKIAQMVFCEVPKVSFEEVSELGETSRGEGGFGSTGC